MSMQDWKFWDYSHHSEPECGSNSHRYRPHRCLEVKEAKAAEAIRDLEKQGILSPEPSGSPTVSTERNLMVLCVYSLTQLDYKKHH